MKTCTQIKVYADCIRYDPNRQIPLIQLHICVTVLSLSGGDKNGDTDAEHVDKILSQISQRSA